VDEVTAARVTSATGPAPPRAHASARRPRTARVDEGERTHSGAQGHLAPDGGWILGPCTWPAPTAAGPGGRGVYPPPLYVS